MPSASRHRSRRVVWILTIGLASAADAAEPACLELVLPPLAIYAGQPTRVTVRLLDAQNGLLAGTNAPARFSAEGTDGTVIIEPPFTSVISNGVWVGSLVFGRAAADVRLTATGGTLEATTRPFRVRPDPVRRVFELPVQDFIPDLSRNRLLATAGEGAGSFSNQLVSLRLDTGAIESLAQLPAPPTTPVPWDARPGRLALADDGRTLYVAVKGATTIRRIDLESVATTAEFAVGTSGDFTLGVADMAPLPGRPGTLVVARRAQSSGDSAIFDDGIARPAIGPGADSLVVSPEGDRAYLQSYWNDVLYQVPIVADGFGTAIEVRDLFAGLWTDLELDRGELFFSEGSVALANGLRRLESYPVTPSGSYVLPYGQNRVALHPDGSRAFFLSQDAETNRLLQVFERASRLPVAAVAFQTARTVVEGRSPVERLAFAGDDLLAFATETRVWLVRPPGSQTGEERAALTLVQGTTTPTARVGEEVAYSWLVTNRGPATATDVWLQDFLPPEVEFVRATTSTGWFSVSNGVVSAALGDLPNGQATEVNLVVRHRSGGRKTPRAMAAAREFDPDLTDNHQDVTLDLPLDIAPDAAAHVSLAAVDLAFDRVSGRLLASLEVPRHSLAGGVVRIVPETGSVEGMLRPDSEPGRLAVSEDGQFLYVETSRSNSIQRLDLVSDGPTVDIPLPDAAEPYQAGIEDIVPVPGQPGSIAVLEQWRPSGPSVYGPHGLYVFDEAVARPESYGSGVFVLGSRLAFAEDPTRLYAVVPDSPARLNRYEVGATGVTYLGLTANLLTSSGPPGALQYLQGRLYTGNGEVVDPVTPALIAQVPATGTGSLVEVDRLAGRVLYLSPSASGWWLRVLEPGLLVELGAVPVTGVLGQPVALRRLGGDRVAFNTTGGQIHIARSSAMSVTASTDLALTVEAGPAALDGSVPIRIGVRNAGPNRAVGPVCALTLPAGVDFLGTSSVFGTLRTNASEVVVPLPDLEIESTIEFAVRLRPTEPGYYSPRLRVASRSPELAVADNQVTAAFASTFQLPPDARRTLRLKATDLAYDSQRGLVYASVPAGGQVGTGQIAAIDPRSGTLQRLVPVGSSPTRLALAPDHSFLYLSLNDDQSIQRFRLADWTTDLTFTLGSDPGFAGPLRVDDLAVAPDNSHVLTVCRRQERNPRAAGVLVFDDGVVRSNVAYAFQGPNTIRYGRTGAELLGMDQDTSSWALRRMEVTGAGVSITETLLDFAGNFEQRFEWVGTNVYTTSGRIASLDPLNRVTSLTDYRGKTSLLTVDRDSRQAFYVRRTGATNFLEAFDAGSFTRTGSISMTNAASGLRGFIRWGADGLAWLSNERIVFARTRLIRPLPGRDTDGDGLSDAWEMAYGLDPNTPDSWLDTDGDGQCNADEFRAGTNPADLTSVLRLSIELNQGRWVLQFASVAGKRYGMERRTELGTGAWEALATGIAGTGAAITLELEPPPGSSTAYYRLRVEGPSP